MSKKNLRLLIILVVLIALAYIYQGPFQDWRKNIGKADNFLHEISIDDIEKIEFIKNDKTVALKKDNEKWKVIGEGDFYAQSNLTSSLINNLTKAAKSDFELISQKADKKDEFQTDDSGIKIKLYRGESLEADFIIGTAGPNFDSTYLSQENIDETYLVDSGLFGVFSATDWRDKTIFNDKKDDIKKIRFQYPNREFVIEKQGEEWQGVSPYEFNVDSEKLGEVLELMAKLTAAEIPEQSFDSTGLEKNLIIIQAEGDSLHNTIMIGEANDEGLYYAKRGDSDNIYLISEEDRGKLDKNIFDLN